jgi:site-specific recombinase XerD
MARRLKVIEAPPAPRIGRLVDDYLAAKRAEGLSSKTLKQYSYALQRVFLPFLAEEGITEPEELSTRAMERLSSRLLERGTEGLTEHSRGGLSKDSVHSYLRPVRWFVNWVNADPESQAQITGKMPLPKLSNRRILDVLTPEELTAMATAAQQRSRRDELIFEVLMRTGVRAGELVLLRPADLVRRDGGCFLRVRGKGDKERLVPVMPKLFRGLEGFVDRQRKVTHSRPRPADDERIFLSLRRSRVTGDHEPLTNSGVEQLVKSIAEDAGITKRVYPHLLRHSFATHWLRKGHSALILKDVLGHADLTMIQRHYGHLTHVDAYDEMAKFLRDA